MDNRYDAISKSFSQNRIRFYHATNQYQVFSLLDELIPDGSSIGCGDSLTLEQLSVFDYLRNREISFLDKHKPGLSHDEKREIYLKNFSSDIFISGANGITLDGKIVNIDGNGSRVAPTIYGPEKVIFVVGENKIEADEESAMARARNIAGPLDAARLGKNTPCVKLKKCTNCRSNDRICNSFVTIASQFNPDRIHLILVSGSYGY